MLRLVFESVSFPSCCRTVFFRYPMDMLHLFASDTGLEGIALLAVGPWRVLVGLKLTMRNGFALRMDFRKYCRGCAY